MSRTSEEAGRTAAYEPPETPTTSSADRGRIECVTQKEPKKNGACFGTTVIALQSGASHEKGVVDLFGNSWVIHQGNSSGELSYREWCLRLSHCFPVAPNGPSHDGRRCDPAQNAPLADDALRHAANACHKTQRPSPLPQHRLKGAQLPVTADDKRCAQYKGYTRTKRLNATPLRFSYRVPLTMSTPVRRVALHATQCSCEP